MKAFVARCCAILVALSAGPALAQSPYQKLSKLTERERSFLRLVFTGQEAKAVEYARLANINVNAIGGEPLSVWFYTIGSIDASYSHYRYPQVQRIVFETFRQNANPRITGETQLDLFCNYAPFTQNANIQINGTPAQQRALKEQQFAEQKKHVDGMAAGFDSLIRYGLRDRNLITQIFVGCFFRNAAGLNEYTYDTLLARMLKAGADINVHTRDGRPIRHAVKTLNAPVVERLVRDGANARLKLRLRCPGQHTTTNLYGYLFGQTEARKREAVARIVAALSSAGLSPYEKVSYITMAGYGQCHTNSLYDAAIDAGQMELAKAIKEAADKARPVPRQQQTSVAPAAASPAPAPARQFGQWQVAALPDGRPYAVAHPPQNDDPWLRELRIECVAGGRLEYVPVPAKEPLHAIWLENSDVQIQVGNGRIAGASAVQLSKVFLTTEKEASQAGGTDTDWSVSFVLNDQGRSGSLINGKGFGLVRQHLLANCKN